MGLNVRLSSVCVCDSRELSVHNSRNVYVCACLFILDQFVNHLLEDDKLFLSSQSGVVQMDTYGFGYV